PLPSSTLDNAAAVIAADARAGLFGPVRLARPSACLGEISGGRINGGVIFRRRLHQLIGHNGCCAASS
ncbi:TPA: hypothetical protein KD300_004651, partial [Escherichia coli]|nr:hypothetical protein [Escherichia coli]